MAEPAGGDARAPAGRSTALSEPVRDCRGNALRFFAVPGPAAVRVDGENGLEHCRSRDGSWRGSDSRAAARGAASGAARPDRRVCARVSAGDRSIRDSRFARRRQDRATGQRDSATVRLEPRLAFRFGNRRRRAGAGDGGALDSSPVRRTQRGSIMRRVSLPLWLVAGAIYLFLYAPIAVVVVYSFNAAGFGAGWTGFTT